MLNGIAPILIFQFYKLGQENQASIASIPIVSQIYSRIGFAPIPLYLDERLTGIYIDTENKSIDVETSVETDAGGGTPIVNQKGLNSVVTINMLANRDSIGVTLLAAMADIIFEKVTSKEYAVSYLNGAVTVFNGLLHQFSIDQNSDDTLYRINLQLTRSTGKTTPPIPNLQVSKSTGALPL